jgi:hypothetical protein
MNHPAHRQGCLCGPLLAAWEPEHRTECTYKGQKGSSHSGSRSYRGRHSYPVLCPRRRRVLGWWVEAVEVVEGCWLEVDFELSSSEDLGNLLEEGLEGSKVDLWEGLG